MAGKRPNVSFNNIQQFHLVGTSSHTESQQHSADLIRVKHRNVTYLWFAETMSTCSFIKVSWSQVSGRTKSQSETLDETVRLTLLHHNQHLGRCQSLNMNQNCCDVQRKLQIINFL